MSGCITKVASGVRLYYKGSPVVSGTQVVLQR